MPANERRTGHRKTSATCRDDRRTFIAVARRPLAHAVSIAACGIALYAAAPAAARAQTAAVPHADNAPHRYSIPAGALAPALRSLASAANALLTFTADQTNGKTTSGINGDYTTQGALAALLAGTGLQALQLDNGGYVLRTGPASASATETLLPTLTVQGVSGLRGDLPSPYPGGQVARGGRVGLLGDKDFMDTPFSVTTYTAQTIEDQQARTIADVIGNNPAFRSIYPDNDVTMDFNVRGNKVKALDTAYGGLYGMTPPGVEALERVEIVTGANALLNGLGPIGGVGGSINLVPKRAQDAPLTRLTTSYISSSQWGVHTDVGRRYGDENQFGIRFNGSYGDGDTMVDRQSKRVGMGALALDYRGERVRLSADLGYRENDTQSPSRTTYVATGFAIPAPPKPGKNWQQPWSHDNTEALMGAVHGEVDIAPDLTAFAAFGASRFREDELFANSQLLDARGNLLQRSVYWPLYRDSGTAEAGLRGKFATGPINHSWSVSGSGLWVNNGIALTTLTTISTNIYTPVFIAQPSIAALGGPGSVPRTGASTVSGVAAADTLAILDDRLQLTVGLRRQSVKSENFSPTTGSTTSRYDKSVTTPAVGLVGKATQNLSLYANYIEGLQQGPIATGGTNVGEIFAPYVSKQHEVGAKVDFGRFAVTLGAYQLTTPNGFVNPTSNLYGINGEQRTRGIELNSFGEVLPGVRLLGGVAFVSAKQTQPAGGLTNGKQVTGAPRVQLNLGAEWDMPAAPGLTLSARAIHTSSQYIDLANLQQIPDWTRFDAGLRYTTQVHDTPVTIRFNVQNLFNKNFWAAGVDGYLVQSLPRTFLLSSTFDF